MRIICILFGMVVAGNTLIFAQTPEPSPSPAPTVAPAAAPADTEVTEDKEDASEEGTSGGAEDDVFKGGGELKGDVVVLKSGKVLEGVQIVRESPAEYEVELVNSGAVTLLIPRKQVTSVQYDDVDPVRERRLKAMHPKEQAQSLIPSEKLAPELNQKLTASISDTPIAYANKDLADVLKELGQKVGVTIVVDQLVLDLPPEKRVWNLEASAGTTLVSLLQEVLPQHFSDLKVVYQYDKILVTTKE
ncbi:MAG: hypothetical protein HY706_18230, partial [Candidatus Hydrogenedentes bacterium]|nr:hypothetical protein [Candidatus Hydrogenedentota bacterium]